MPLVRGGAPVMSATLPASALLGALRQGGLPAQLSRSAGRYLCNALFYWSLSEAGAGGPLVSFIHMPAFGAEGAARPLLTLKQAVAGTHVLIRASARAVLGARQSGNGIRGGSNENGSQALHGARWHSSRADRHKRR
jgi:pyroglutamyl-peptidase